MGENLLNNEVLSELGVNELSRSEWLMVGGCNNNRFRIGSSLIIIIDGKKYCKITTYRPFGEKKIKLVPLEN